MTVKVYEIGGCVRDEILGLPTKDIDYTVVASSYAEMKTWLNDYGFEIFVETPQYLTIRARFPKGVQHFGGRCVSHLTADFVLARKDGSYYDGRHPDTVEPGTLFDDVMRRDFTMNALAKDENGGIIDLVSGLRDIENRVICCVGSAKARFSEDGLRAIRAIRFSITKNFSLDDDIVAALDSDWIVPLVAKVSVERRREELLKCFKYNTLQTLAVLGTLRYDLWEAIFADGLWLEPTNKEK